MDWDSEERQQLRVGAIFLEGWDKKDGTGIKGEKKQQKKEGKNGVKSYNRRSNTETLCGKDATRQDL